MLDLAGTRETADLDVLNPQTVLKDGDCIIIRSKDAQEMRISINTGTMEELCTLPGIGETTAAKIIEYREANGYYQTLDTSFAVLLDGNVIGNCSLFSNSVTRSVRSLSVLECAFYVHPSYQGRGFGSEALNAVLDLAFSEKLANAVIAGVLSDNVTAEDFIRRNGGRYCFSRPLQGGGTERFYLFTKN